MKINKKNSKIKCWKLLIVLNPQMILMLKKVKLREHEIMALILGFEEGSTVDPWFSDHRFCDNPWFSDTFAADQFFT